MGATNPASYDQLAKASDRELVAAVVAGHPYAWPVFSRRFERLIRACVERTARWYGVSLERAEYEDLVSAVCLSLVEDNYRRLRMFDASRGYRLSSWVGLIATNTTIDALRRRVAENISFEEQREAGGCDWTIETSTPEENLERQEEVSLLLAAVERLGENDRLFLDYYYVHDLEPEEIAARMGISVATVYSRKNKIREKLKGWVARLSAVEQREGTGSVSVEPNG